ncbi:MAG: TolC family protein [Bacteroidota bacterium]|nr:TolC family protein [Bacteroidota bacterium]
MLSKLKHILLPAVMILGGTVLSIAQETQGLSLGDAIKMALQNNTNMLNSKLDLQIARKKIEEVTATGLPHIDAKSAYQHLFIVPVLNFPGTQLSDTRVPFDSKTSLGTISELQLSTGENIYLNNIAGAPIQLGIKDNVSTDITVSQLIFSGSFLIGLQATKVYFNLTKQNDEKTRLDIIETVVNTYHMIQLAQESRGILAQNLENINKTLSEILEMQKQGFVEKTDVDQLDVTANNVRNAINQIDSNLDMGNRLMKIQLGLEDTVTIALTDSTESGDSLIRSSMQLVTEQFNENQNVDYKLMKTMEDLAGLDLKLSKSKFLPTISGFYNHNYQLNSPGFNFVPKDLIGINLSLPIFSSGERLAVVSQKNMALRKARNSREFVSRSLAMEASQCRNDVKLKLERYLNQKKSKELSDEIYQRTLEKYKQGMSSSMDLMNSQNQYLTNLTNYYQSIYDLQGAKSKLEKLLNINQDTGGK